MTRTKLLVMPLKERSQKTYLELSQHGKDIVLDFVVERPPSIIGGAPYTLTIDEARRLGYTLMAAAQAADVG